VRAPGRGSGLPKGDPNLHVYNLPRVAAHYAALEYLSAEKLFFERYIQPGESILDLGVGGGRTTPYLSARASRYVGVDYAREMIALCQRKFPGVSFVVADAAMLSAFADARVGAAVMAFSGVDYVLPESSRRAAVAEIHRVLKPSGVFIFSSHNPHAIWHRPAWNPRRLEQMARGLAGYRGWLFRMTRSLLTVMRVALAFAEAFLKSCQRALRRLPARAFWRREAYMVDSVHGGLLTHYAAPGEVHRELRAADFELLQIAGNDYAEKSREFTTDWYYYVFSKKPQHPGYPKDVSGSACI
jgi:ubiquinone/menaquinone biosynthesis C-methylase UbiE